MYQQIEITMTPFEIQSAKITIIYNIQLMTAVVGEPDFYTFNELNAKELVILENIQNAYTLLYNKEIAGNIKVQTAPHTADRYSLDVNNPDFTTVSNIQTKFENVFEGALMQVLMLINDGTINPNKEFVRTIIAGKVVS